MAWFKDNVEVTELKWTAPTENTDGSPITQALTYNLYIDGTNALSFPGTLNPDGRYSFPIGSVAQMQPDGTYDLYLTAVDEDGDESDPSNSIIIISLTRTNPPVNFTAE